MAQRNRRAKETALCIPGVLRRSGESMLPLYFQIAPVQTELFNVEVFPARSEHP